MADIAIKIDDAQVLAALERLRAAIGGRISVEIGTNVVYGAIHQFGGAAGHKDRRVQIPARPFLGLSVADRIELLAIVEGETKRAWEGETVRPDDIARQLGRAIKSSTQLRFREQKGPDGRPWKKSQRVRRRGGQTLRLTSRLRNSITYGIR